MCYVCNSLETKGTARTTNLADQVTGVLSPPSLTTSVRCQAGVLTEPDNTFLTELNPNFAACGVSVL